MVLAIASASSFNKVSRVEKAGSKFKDCVWFLQLPVGLAGHLLDEASKACTYIHIHPGLTRTIYQDQGLEFEVYTVYYMHYVIYKL